MSGHAIGTTGGAGHPPPPPPPAVLPPPIPNFINQVVAPNHYPTRFNRIGYSLLYQSDVDPTHIRVLNTSNMHLYLTNYLPRAAYRTNMIRLKTNIPQITSIREYRRECGVSLRPATRLLTSLMSSLFYESAKYYDASFTYNKLLNYNTYDSIHNIMYQTLYSLIGKIIPLRYIFGIYDPPDPNPAYSYAACANILQTIYGTADLDILRNYYKAILPDTYDDIDESRCPHNLYLLIVDGHGKIYVKITNDLNNNEYYKRNIPGGAGPIPILGVSDLIGIHATIYPRLTAPFGSGHYHSVIDGYHITDYYGDLDVGQEQEYFHDIGMPILPGTDRRNLAQFNIQISILHNYIDYLIRHTLYINNLKQLSLYGIDYFEHHRIHPGTGLPGQQRFKRRYIVIPLQIYSFLMANTINDTYIYNEAFEPHLNNEWSGGSRKQLAKRRKNRNTKVRSNKSRFYKKQTYKRRK